MIPRREPLPSKTSVPEQPRKNPVMRKYLLAAVACLTLICAGVMPASAATVRGATITTPHFIGGAEDPCDGEWQLWSDGIVKTFGDAVFYGDLSGGIVLDEPPISLTAGAAGHGYWILSSDGGVFGFGDAHFLGSAGGLKLVEPIVGMAATPDGHGYWLVASDGGVFTYGDAHFYGSAAGDALAASIVGMGSMPDGHGYYLVGSDGGVFAFGDAPYLGSAAGTKIDSPPITGIDVLGDGTYGLIQTDGIELLYGSGLLH